uniref:THAP-type domain-containing protein n=1 Tax=Oncorhynchus tshawytscha TaxID=74940 RepID=A0AAZ3SXG6_ONCTS
MKSLLLERHSDRGRSECTCVAPYDLHPPPEDAESLRLWLKALNLKKPPKHQFVCSKHFFVKKSTVEHPYPEKWLGYDAPLMTKRCVLVRQSSMTDDTTGQIHQIENGDWPTQIEGMDMPSEKHAQAQWEDPSLSDHNYCSGDHVKPTTCEAGAQCPEAPLYKTLPWYEAEHPLPLYEGSFQFDLTVTLMKLKLNLLQQYLAERFGVSQRIVSRVISYLIDMMEENPREYIPRLLRETIRATMPQCFKDHYPGRTCIIDCSEMALQKSKNLDSRGESFSHYYTQNTIKYLVAIAPCGLVMFISSAYSMEVDVATNIQYNIGFWVPGVPLSRC